MHADGRVHKVDHVVAEKQEQPKRRWYHLWAIGLMLAAVATHAGEYNITPINIAFVAGVKISTSGAVDAPGTPRVYNVAPAAALSFPAGALPVTSTGTTISTGSITAFQGGVWTIATTPPASQVVTFSSGSSGSALYVQSTSTLPVSVAALPAITGSVSVSNFPAAQAVNTVSTFPVSGTFWQATQPVNGSVTVNGSTVAITNVAGSTITAVLTNSSVGITGSVTVAGAVTVNTSTVAVTNVNGVSLNVACTSGCSGASGGATTVTPGTGTWTVAFTSGSFTNPFYTVSTNTLVTGSSVTVVNSTVSLNGVGLLATAAAQTTGNASLSSLDGKVTAVNTGAIVFSGSQPVNTTSTFPVTVNNFPASQPVTFSSGSAAASALFVQTTSTLPVAATLAAETTKVIGTVNVAAGQSLAVTNAGTFAVQAAPNGVFSVGFTSGSFSNALYTLSTGAVVSTGSISAFQAGTWNHPVTFTTGSFSNPIYILSTGSVVSTGTITAYQGGAWSVGPVANVPLLVSASSAVAFAFVSTATLASNTTMFCLMNKSASSVIRVLDLTAFNSSSFTVSASSTVFNLVLTTATSAVASSNGSAVSSGAVDGAYAGQLNAGILISSNTLGFGYLSGQNATRGIYRALYQSNAPTSAPFPTTVLYLSDSMKPQLTLRPGGGVCIFSTVANITGQAPEINFNGVFTQQ